MAVGVFALLRLGWPAIEWLFLARSPTGLYRETVLYYWFNRINPMNAYGKATSLLLEPAPGGVGNPFLPGTEEIVAPIAQSGAFAVAVLLAWAVLAPLVGYWVFTNRDAI
jgi:ABC-type transport system involved in multi-copper enzyme maturation permease subunit